MQSADQVEANGSHVSTAGFKTGPWYRIQCPTTVLAALVKAGEYEDLYVGTNLSTIPRARFEQCWWYRCEFDVTDICEVETTLLEFDGINYGANIYVNGRLIANARQVHGAFRRFCFDISKWVHPGVNVLAVEVSPPRPGDFSTGFVDWNPPSPDLNMGIFRPVTLRGCQSISIDNPFVQVDLDTETLDKADLTVSAELCNHGNRPVTGVLRGNIESICFEQTVTLRAGQQIKVEFTPAEYRDLHVLQPRIWWPHDLGEPNLYELNLDFYVDEVVSDTCQTRFGMRQVEDYFNEAGHRGFKINGRQVLIRAGGWTDDMLLADTPEKLQAQIQYVKHMNLNCIRLEGFWGTDHTLYDLCDAYGILIMVGWSCHWEHEQYLGKPVDNRFGGVASPGDIELIAKSWRDQVVWLRNHASVFAWTVASDKVPHPDLERRYIEIFEQYDATRPYLASTGGVGSEQAIIGTDVVVSDLSGPTGVKMLGPYAYTPPIYWYEDTERGGAYGFNTETGPGAQVPVLSSLKQMLPADKRWPINEGWHFHCGLNEFGTLDRTCQALEKRYGPTQTLEAFAQKAQVLNYELIRPMFEAFRVQKGRATGIVQWMLNAAWPKMYWQLYDWYLMPTGAFYGTKKACEPVQLIYNYAKRSIHLVNDTPHAYENLSVHIRVLDLHARDIFLHSLEASAAALSSQALLTLPECPDLTQTSFLDLRLYNTGPRPMATNLYWLSSQPDVLDYDAPVEPWEYYTPSLQYADYSLLNELPPAQLEVRCLRQSHENACRLAVTVQNTGTAIAFAVELTVVNTNTGLPVVPVYWDDNYVTLLPGETRVLGVTLEQTMAPLQLRIQAWNSESMDIHVKRQH